MHINVRLKKFLPPLLLSRKKISNDLIIPPYFLPLIQFRVFVWKNDLRAATDSPFVEVCCVHRLACVMLKSIGTDFPSPTAGEIPISTCSTLIPSEAWKSLKVPGEAHMERVPEALSCYKLPAQKKIKYNLALLPAATDFSAI